MLKKLGDLREKIPKPKPGQKTKFQDDVVMLNELLQVRRHFSRFQKELSYMFTSVFTGGYFVMLVCFYRTKRIISFREIFKDHNWLLSSLEIRESQW